MRAMEKPDSARFAPTVWMAACAALVTAILAAHGFHPLAEDGGLYVAGVEWLLNPTLFPHDAAFVRAHLGYSVFAPFVAMLVRRAHLTLDWALLLVYLATAAATLWAGRRVLARVGASAWAQAAGIALLAAWWTMPVAGTSLLLMDPYVTARSVSTPASLAALAWALEDWRARPRAAVLCIAAIAIAAAFHPLMAMYGAGMVLAVRLMRMPRSLAAWGAVCVAVVAVAAVLQAHAPPESAAVVEAARSRYYWFLSQWQWYERVGLLGPALVLGMLLRWRPRAWNARATEVMRAALALCALGFVVALVFGQEHFRAHAVARLQPLRVYLESYAVMALLVGAAAAEVAVTLWTRNPRRLARVAATALPVALVGASFAAFAAVERMSFTASPAIEWPWNADAPRNPWALAFVWLRQNTANDALVALDAKYVNEDGEDAQVFRAWAQRSMLPDFSKDGGEAAITPPLADAWQRGASAQMGLSAISDSERRARLHGDPVNWIVLHRAAQTALPCPYANAVVKVCRFE